MVGRRSGVRFLFLFNFCVFLLRRLSKITWFVSRIRS